MQYGDRRETGECGGETLPGRAVMPPIRDARARTVIPTELCSEGSRGGERVDLLVYGQGKPCPTKLVSSVFSVRDPPERGSLGMTAFWALERNWLAVFLPDAGACGRLTSEVHASRTRPAGRPRDRRHDVARRRCAIRV